jgi:hypothetical protein
MAALAKMTPVIPPNVNKNTNAKEKEKGEKK